MSEIRTVLRRTSEFLLPRRLAWAAANWVGVGLALKRDGHGVYVDEFVVTLWFANQLPFLPDQLRLELRAFGLPDVEIEFQVTGWLAPLDGAAADARFSPLSIGVNFQKDGLGFQAGTLGAVVRRDADPSAWLMLSNNHILYLDGVVLGHGNQPRVCCPSPLWDSAHAAQNAMGTVHAMPPECELQDRPARNTGDFALASIDDQSRVAAVVRPAVRKPVSADGLAGATVMKTGASTETTKGIVTAVHQEFTLRYPSTKMTYEFENQIVIEGAGFSAGGDSGSLVWTAAGEPVGLLFAGNGPRNVAAPLDGLFGSLGLSFVLPGE